MEKLDRDISGWIMEFLLRSSVPDSLVQKTLTALPLSGADSRLKKTLLLRILQSQLLKASLSETALQILELLDELDRNDAVHVSDTMRRAYCAVAVECTVKYLIASPEDPSGEYLAAVRRIWRGRVVKLAGEGRPSELISVELERWRDDVEAALLDPRVSERLAGLNTRRDALNEVKAYLKEAWEIMGPSFLDSVAMMSKAKALRPEGVYEIALPVRKRDERLESSAKEKRDSVGGDRSESSDDDDNDNDNHNGKDDGGACCMVMDNVAVVGENQGKEHMKERVGASQKVGGRVSPAKGVKAIQKSNLQLRHKHSALRSCHRGVKISGSEEVEPEKSWSKYDDPLSSAEAEKVRVSLKSSSLELRAMVKDPLPDALHMSEVVRSKLATKNINLEPPIENRSGYVDVPDQDVCKSIVLYQPNDANLGKKSPVHCRDVHHPSLMEQKSTAHTHEWDDSIDNLPQGRQAQPRRRKRKWTSLEEETLRAGVKMFGEGNWATIRNFYSNIFENRSGVDLKDKWRNMMR